MKRLGIVAMLIIMVLVIPVSAHSLQWGLAVDDQFEYTAHGHRADIGNVDIDYSLTITWLETIPYEVVVLETWPRVSVRLINLEDSSTVDMGNDIAEHCWAYAAVPIGDWSYLSTAMEAYAGTGSVTTAFENATHWGYTIDGDNSAWRYIKTAFYLKENGILEYHDGYLWSYADSEVVEHVIIERTTASTSTTTDSATTTTTETTTSTTQPSTTSQTLQVPLSLEQLALVGVGIVVMYSLYKRRTPSGDEPFKSDAKVLIVCPYCGAKTEQGLLKCRNCQAKL